MMKVIYSLSNILKDNNDVNIFFKETHGKVNCLLFYRLFKTLSKQGQTLSIRT